MDQKETVQMVEKETVQMVEMETIAQVLFGKYFEHASAASAFVFNRAFDNTPEYSLLLCSKEFYLPWKINGKTIKLKPLSKLEPVKQAFNAQGVSTGGCFGIYSDGSLLTKVHIYSYQTIEFFDNFLHTYSLYEGTNFTFDPKGIDIKIAPQWTLKAHYGLSTRIKESYCEIRINFVRDTECDVVGLADNKDGQFIEFTIRCRPESEENCRYLLFVKGTPKALKQKTRRMPVLSTTHPLILFGAMELVFKSFLKVLWKRPFSFSDL